MTTSSELLRSVLYVVISGSVVVASFVGVRRYRPKAMRAWSALIVGQSLWLLADIIDQWQVLHGTWTFPSIADVAYVCGYVALIVGFVLLLRPSSSGSSLGAILDCAIVVVALSLLSWVLLAHPVMQALSADPVAAAVEAAYCGLDILLLGGLIRLLHSPAGGTPAFRLLCTSLLLLIAADTLTIVAGAYALADTRLVDHIWLASYVLWGGAVLHPTMASLTDPGNADDGEDPGSFRGLRVIVLAVATLIAPGVLFVEYILGRSLDVYAVCLVSGLLFLAVVWRMNVTLARMGVIMKQRTHLQQRLTHQAEHDALTGLPNRARARRLLAAALDPAQAFAPPVAMLFVDLDGYKRVNDMHGHPAGDAVLQIVASRLTDVLPTAHVVARLGGDEFVALLIPAPSEQRCEQVATDMIAALSQPMTLPEGDVVQVGASVGVAVGTARSTTVERLMGEADAAVYRAKRRGKGRVEVFNRVLREELNHRLQIESALREAIVAHELCLRYQPIVDLQTGEIHGYEALVRWDRPGYGLLSPDQFLPIAEDSELICDVDVWVLNEALTRAAMWNTGSGPVRTMAVNLSGRHIAQARIVSDVMTVINRTGVSPRHLVLEVTETVMLDGEGAVLHLQALRDLGVAISLDDFGTGYNSVTQLTRLPIDMVKLDRRYVDTTSVTAVRLLELMVHAAQAFGLPVVAEGVECLDQLHLLEALHCEFAQGYYLGRPMPSEQIADFEVTRTLRRSPQLLESVDQGRPVEASREANETGA